MTDRFAAFEARVRHDLACVNYPPANWPAGPSQLDGRPVLDVLVVGGGQLGQTAAFALIRAGIRNLRVVDRAPAGQEGPWATTARMPTLRSPKHLTGPDLGIPSLTFRAWYEAMHGEAAWEALYKIGRTTWVEYLLWLRRITGVPVENKVALTRLIPGRQHGDVTLAHGDGTSENILARHVVFALGREGYGGGRVPAFPSFDPEARTDRVRHAGEPIDFSRCAGGAVAVLGANASAFDAAATALEAGATVTMWSRRRHLPQVNFTRGMTAGYLQGFCHLDDETRWALSTRLADEAAPPPHESVLRCTAHAGFSLRFGEGWRDLAVDSEGVTVTSAKGPERFDTAILGTGYTLDLTRQPAFEALASDILLWADRVGADKAALHPELARHPYLDKGFGLVDRMRADSGLRRIHLLGPPAAVNHGTLAGDIPGLAPSCLRLAGAISTALFTAEADQLADRLFAFDEPELAATAYFVSRAERSRACQRLSQSSAAAMLRTPRKLFAVFS